MNFILLSDNKLSKIMKNRVWYIFWKIKKGKYMKIRNSVKISFKGKDYEIDIERISYVISKIEDCEMKLSTKEEIIPYLKK